MATERTSPASPRRRLWLLTAGLLAALAVGTSLTLARPSPASASPSSGLGRGLKKVRAHFDHSPLFSAKFETPQAVTRACLSCHPDSAEVMKSSHWLWLGDATPVPGHDGGAVRLGKKNVLNNFCLSIRGNERSCTKCHAGFGWVDDTFDFSNKENVDCLVCHEGTNAYVKGLGGTPTPETDLLAAARSVGTPRRENCLGCHAYGGGGQAVKHGDLDSSLAHPFEEDDVHIGRHQFLCIDCHAAPHHQIQGRAFSVGVEDSHGVACTDCHSTAEHRDERLNAHVASLACQTCHIPRFAWRIPTKATWDWSKAGDPNRAEDPHHYLKIKGEFTYEQGARPEYRWFNGTVGRYLLGDPIDATQVTALNPPRRSARPHLALQDPPGQAALRHQERVPARAGDRRRGRLLDHLRLGDHLQARREGVQPALQRQLRLRRHRDVLAALPHGGPEGASAELHRLPRREPAVRLEGARLPG